MEDAIDFPMVTQVCLRMRGTHGPTVEGILDPVKHKVLLTQTSLVPLIVVATPKVVVWVLVRRRNCLALHKSGYKENKKEQYDMKPLK